MRRGARLGALLERKVGGQLESSIDSVLVLGSKTASSSNYREGWGEWVEDNLVDPCRHYLRLFEGVAQQLAYRRSLGQVLAGLTPSGLAKAGKLTDRISAID